MSRYFTGRQSKNGSSNKWFYIFIFTFKAITKSQFIRIRRICITLDDYWFHATNFISFFKSRGFNEMALNKTAEEIAEKPHSNFFPDNDGTLTQVLKDMGKSTRVPFVTTWSHKLSDFQESALPLQKKND